MSNYYLLEKIPGATNLILKADTREDAEALVLSEFDNVDVSKMKLLDLKAVVAYLVMRQSLGADILSDMLDDSESDSVVVMSDVVVV